MKIPASLRRYAGTPTGLLAAIKAAAAPIAVRATKRHQLASLAIHSQPPCLIA